MPGIAFHRLGKKASGIDQPTPRQCLGPLIKSSDRPQSEQTQHDLTEQQIEDSRKPSA